MKGAKGDATSRSDELGEAQLVAYEFGGGSRPTSTMTAESFGINSSSYHTSASDYPSAGGRYIEYCCPWGPIWGGWGYSRKNLGPYTRPTWEAEVTTPKIGTATVEAGVITPKI